MANSKIMWTDKESLVTDPTIAEKNKVTDSNMNEIKSVVNENADQVILSDTEPTSTDNEIWVDTSSNATYINQEVNIGATNPSNTRTWFKQGKNIFSSSLELGTFSNEGVKSASTTNYRSATPIQVQPNTTYTFSINGVSQKYGIYYYNNTNTFISSEGLTTGTFTTPANCYYINFRCFNADFTSDYANLKIQLEQGSTATSYEAYITPQIIIDNREVYNQPVILYENKTSSNLGGGDTPLTLSDSIANYRKLTIFYDRYGIQKSVDVYTDILPSTNTIGVILDLQLFLNNIYRLYTSYYTISGNTMTLSSRAFWNGDGNPPTTQADNQIRVSRIIGYK